MQTTHSSWRVTVSNLDLCSRAIQDSIPRDQQAVHPIHPIPTIYPIYSYNHQQPNPLLYSIQSNPLLYLILFQSNFNLILFNPLLFLIPLIHLVLFHLQFLVQVCIYLYIYFAFHGVLVFVCLYPINVKTAEPIGPEYVVGSRVTPGMVDG